MIELRDHSKPCIHVNVAAVELAAARAISHPNDVPVWKCDVTGCPGGQEVIIDYEAAIRAWFFAMDEQLPDREIVYNVLHAALGIGETDAN